MKLDWNAMPLISFLSTSDLNRNQDEIDYLLNFWRKFLKIADNIYENAKCVKTSKSGQYKNQVFDILREGKMKMKKRKYPSLLSEKELIQMQVEIEDLTLKFDEKSMYKTAPNLIKMLIRKDGRCAKDFLLERKLIKEDMELLSEFGQYTLEALIVHVLGMLFTIHEYNPIIRVASLVERLESSVRQQAYLLKSQRNKRGFSISPDQEDVKKKRSKLEKMYPFGTFLVEFMEERELITLTNDLKGSSVRVNKGSYYLPCHLYAVCNFDISLLPIKLNLPMVCQPLDWKPACRPDETPRYLSDLSGGYLSGPSGEIYDRYRLLSSSDLNQFYINISSNYKKLCCVMNKLQHQPFQINSYFLQFLFDNFQKFIESGYLLPPFVGSIIINDVSPLLRDLYMKDDYIKKLCSFSELLQTLCKNIQRSRYEKMILTLAEAYEGYHFYLPAFLDFRGRIYRCGVLHFHERDLARSLIIFADCYDDANLSLQIFVKKMEAVAFHYDSFDSYKNAYVWLKKKQIDLKSQDNMMKYRNSIIQDGFKAKRPFQYISNLFGIHDVCGTPITQDASASAYQIMSYLLMDESLAKRTNLIQSSDGMIKDIYSFFLEEFKVFIKTVGMEDNLSSAVISVLDRKIVKGIFMPMIYGKTMNSTSHDLREYLSHYMSNKECFRVASVCFEFWRTKYHGLECLIRLIRDIGWFAAARGSAVIYSVPYFTTVQDYMKTDAINIWLYDRLHKKRRRVTLRVSSSTRDRRKTDISTFVNFIHQKDAYIAMSVVDKMLSQHAPIYTVHDNFITTARYCGDIPEIYSNVICDMGSPLSMINEFIYMNVINPIEIRDQLPERSYAFEVISKDTLSFYLRANVPKNLSKSVTKTWDERIARLLSSYATYTRLVCGDYQSPEDGWIAHQDKWEKFKLKVRCDGNQENYSVHY